MPITDDTIVESTETFTVTVSNPGGTLASDVTVSGSANEATVEIIDNDVATLTIADVEVNESAGTVDIIVQLSQALPVEFTVEIATADDTVALSGLMGAIAGEDYTAKSETLNFGIGDTEKTFQVAILEDTIVENDMEAFTVAASTPGGTLANSVTLPGPATVRILDTDMATVTIADIGTVAEDIGTVNANITLSNPVAAGFGLEFSFVADTATLNEDYTDGITLSRVFSSGDPSESISSLEVPIVNDNMVEPLSESFGINGNYK